MDAMVNVPSPGHASQSRHDDFRASAQPRSGIPLALS
jgi:hypothetical protein